MVPQITGVSSAPTVIPELESIAKAQYDVFCSTHFDDIIPNVTSRHLALIRGIGADHHFSLLCRGILEKNDIILQIKVSGHGSSSEE